LSKWPLYFGQRRQSGSVLFSDGLLAAPLAIDDKQHVRLALKVGTADESSAIDQDLAAAFVANRIGYTSSAHPPPSPLGVLFSMARERQSDAQTHCNLILVLGRI
jgi:hypothetical protein